ncbi:MAG: indolepyruvate ferredoxin oxidoreductase [Hydrogenophaga sp.]|uniref:indolepyruvate ferredoxin oxidoreductase subunit alpha n=1 Tax=Hydrogenophaga sp. TaxID=1904254 RepID=UPI0016B3E728|nr:indolepyruvate ferredoxin oxidoreductase subunit alpha [Hydrogenophaga sp.]NIM42993.1 indolepyruvate ferredoxin oxidoreductase [Hydrogenophaga sp.]NIN27923.1 indolepyruvate ferredoxin oxidoreductase [Hydrogenophaga sp.]NIN32700.1 indolepyruvate ferredoxin oxidoreductase [Hydrogenophaga sp.]NIN57196.1 indolepyruvate ferredoxin oxidoreductase [Hydrogenophaga sp.]NIO53612.1 indolepyruvate ferredoxin oxidoreductase [Hydrogenophaga sp.]
MERSFHREIEALKLGQGETFHGEGILAVTKALLQSGVTYVGGYQGSPITHLLDVMVQARDYMDELGVHVEACTNESSAAAMLAASIMYPVRGAVTWKSVVGTNVASDALSNLASAGVMGGALIVVGEDYGEGASVIQERTHAFAMKSALWLMDPRPNLPTIVRMVEKSFELSEASNTPVMMELRIRACHVRGSFDTKDNVAPAISTRQLQTQAANFSYDRLSHPPATFRHEKLKYEVRLPAARRYIVDAGLNEHLPGRHDGVGIIVQGGLTNTALRALQLAGLADGEGHTDVPMLVLNVVYPLVPEQIADFCRGKRAVLVMEEGQPDFIEQEISAHLRRAKVDTPLHGKDLLPMGGEYTAEVLLKGIEAFMAEHLETVDVQPARALSTEVAQLRAQASEALGGGVPQRPPNFCVGCPERPVFAALKLVERDTGKLHISTDIGCHSFATFEPFSFGNSILGYGMSMASSAAVKNFSAQRPVAIMGDGGFWHNGLLSGVSSALLNQGDGVLVIMKNGYTSATGTQETISTPEQEAKQLAEGNSATATETTIEDTLKGMGVKWIRTVHNYRVSRVRDTLKEAIRSPFKGLKVVIAEGECQLERQRRLKPIRARRMKEGLRSVRVRYGVDEDTCTGDHSCIRLSGCPTLTVKASSDPLRREPVAHVTNGCVGCGLCGEVADAAVLCPSFHQIEIISNPSWWDRVNARLNRFFIGLLQPA